MTDMWDEPAWDLEDFQGEDAEKVCFKYDEIERISKNAIYFIFRNNNYVKHIWLPKSQIEYDKKYVWIPLWLVENNKLPLEWKEDK